MLTGHEGRPFSSSALGFAVSALLWPASIRLPIGFAREGSVIEFIDGPTSMKLRLRAIAARHGEFERMLFEIVL